MKVICCACGKDMGEKEPLDDQRITHSYCSECYAAELATITKETDSHVADRGLGGEPAVP